MNMLDKNILFLTIKKHWFDEILSGRKTEEYRQIKKYYINKFINKKYNKILLQAGYSKTSPRLIADIISIEVGKRQFDLFEFEVFVIKLKNPNLTTN